MRCRSPKAACPEDPDGARATDPACLVGSAVAVMLVVPREALETCAECWERLLEGGAAAVDLWVAQGAPE